MKKMLSFIVLSISLLILVSGCSSDYKKGKEASNRIDSTNKNKVQEKEFSFSLLDSKGKNHQLADYQGKPLVVKYWASWCPICLAGLDEIEALSADKKKDYELITIVTPDYKNEKPTSEFIEWFDTLEAENSIVLFDEGGELAKKLGIRAYPSFVYYDSQGEMINVLPGHADKETIEKNSKEI